MKLRAKTSILIASLAAVLIVIVAGILLRYLERALHDHILAGLDAVAGTASLNIEAFVRDGRHATSLIAAAVPRQPLIDGLDLAGVERVLQQSMALAPRFRNGLFILNADGRFLVDYPEHPELRGESFAFRDYYQRAVAERGPVTSEPYVSKRTGKPVITFAAPIITADGTILAVLGCSVDLLAEDALGPVLQQRIGKTGYLYAMDRTRQMILHPDETRILKRDVPPGVNRVLDAAIGGFEGVGETVNSRGVPMLIAVRKISGTPWFVAVQVPRAEAMQPLVEERWAMIRFSAGLLLLALIVGLWAARRITGPIGTLHRAAAAIDQELGAGRLDLSRARAAVEMLQRVQGRDEIGDLARLVETLTDRLDGTLHSLTLAAAEWERSFHAVTEPIFRLDEAWRIVQLNSAAALWLREPPSTLVGKRMEEVLFGAEPPADWPRPEILQAQDAQREFRWQTNILRGERQTWAFSAVALYDGERRRAGTILVARDITTQLAEEERMRTLAFHDTLTGLPNRLLLADRLQQALAAARREGQGVAVIFLDLDRFKEVNDTLGHEAGDVLLVTVAQRMQNSLRASDTLARVGGDEFVIILPGLTAAGGAVSVAEKILRVIAEPIDLPGTHFQVGVSIGIALYPACGEDGDTLLRAADAAMYRAKQEGRNTYRMSERVREA